MSNDIIKVNNRTQFGTFSAIGCTNMIPPENAWLRRSNNDIIIGCYSSQQTWQLKCDGRKWKGLVGTCPELCKIKSFFPIVWKANFCIQEI